jgi:hypothetical protein
MLKVVLSLRAGIYCFNYLDCAIYIYRLEFRTNDCEYIKLNKKILRDCISTREEFQAFEFAYRVLQPEDRVYLREQSAAYKRAVLEVQELVLPVVNEYCPACVYGTCCRLHSPELNIYIARSVGCFTVVDYLLVRCETELPEPDFGNSAKNLCAFWNNGCRLNADCRSLMCLKFFCEPLRHVLNMNLVNKRVAAVQSVTDNFSLGKLLKKQHQ